MHVVGIVVEYNPFHNGHLYHLQEAKRLTGADYCVAVMSGSFVQRGAPAIVDKYTRARMALENGVDLVLELPVPFAVGSAEDFASGAVSVLNGLGVVDSLCFGSECGSLEPIEQVADILADEPEDYRQALRGYLRKGLSFPAARERALADYLSLSTRADGGGSASEETVYNEESVKSLLSSPNNILAVEYVKALRRLHSPIRPCTIKRHVSSYHSTKLEERYSSASAIRACLEQGDLAAATGQMPPSAFRLLSESQFLTVEDFSSMLSYRLLSLREEELTQFADVSRELASRIRRLDCPAGFEETVTALKSRQYTYTRVSRALLHILLDIREEQMAGFRQSGYAAYARALGFRRRSLPLLTEIKKHATLPFITKTAGQADPMFLSEVFASNLYRTAYSHRYHKVLKDDFNQGLILIEESEGI